MTCDSCGAGDDDVLAVRRMYVTPADRDTAGSAVTMPGIEWWCVACCTMYPHEAIDRAGPIGD